MIKPKLWLIKQQLKTKSPALRLSAVRQLRKIEDDSIIGLLGEALADEDPTVRCEAAKALGDDLDARAVPALARALNDSNEAVQEAVIESLKKIGGSDAVDVLVGAFFRGSAKVKWRASQALRLLRWQPTTVEEQIQWAVANGELEMLPSFGEAAIQPLASMMVGAPFERRVAIVRALAAIPDPSAQKPLLEALQDENVSVRTAAAAVLVTFPATTTVSALLRVLKDNEKNVRAAAANTLGKLGDPQAVEPLIRALGEKTWEVRVAITEALGMLGDARAFQAVAAQMEDQDEAVRLAANEAVGNVGNDSILEKLVLNLVDKNTGIRGAAGRSLQKICPGWERSDRVKRMLPEIQAMMNNCDASTQFAIAGLLQRVGGEATASQAMAEIARVATADLTGTKTSGSSAILRELLGDADKALRFAAEQAANAIGQDIFPVSPLPESERPVLAEVVIFSEKGAVLHAWPADAARQRLRAIQLIAEHGRRLTSGIKLGEFDRLQLDCETQRVVMKVSENGVAFVRAGKPGVAIAADNPEASVYRPVAMGEGAKEHITSWLKSAASTRGVLLRGVRFPDKTFVCDVDSQFYPIVALEQLYGYVVEIFQTMKQMSPVQLSWVFARTAVHFARRADGTMLGAFSQVKLADADRAELTALLAEFRRL